jgi:hypothetical protein
MPQGPGSESTSCNLTPARRDGNLTHVQLSAAMLADSAQIRDGTLFLLGGGFGRLLGSGEHHQSDRVRRRPVT